MAAGARKLHKEEVTAPMDNIAFNTLETVYSNSKAVFY
jgi:hypothetical protein